MLLPKSFTTSPLRFTIFVLAFLLLPITGTAGPAGLGAVAGAAGLPAPPGLPPALLPPLPAPAWLATVVAVRRACLHMRPCTCRAEAALEAGALRHITIQHEARWATNAWLPPHTPSHRCHAAAATAAVAGGVRAANEAQDRNAM